MRKKPIVIKADPTDDDDFNVSRDALECAQRARLVRTTRAKLGLSQVLFAKKFCVPVGTLRDWEQARVTPPDYAMAYIRVIACDPELVMKAVA